MASSIDPDVFALIIDQFERVEAQTGRSRYRVFDEWLKFVVTTLARDDDTYADLVTDLKQTAEDESTARECLEAYAGAFGLLVDAMADVTVPAGRPPRRDVRGLRRCQRPVRPVLHARICRHGQSEDGVP